MVSESGQVLDDVVRPEKLTEDANGNFVSGDLASTTPTVPSPRSKIQLRPVGHPSPVTQLFEYTVKAWNNQKGDHCTYRYISSRDPAAPMEMIATVLVRLPNKQPLYVKDTRSRASRVIAQNSVAHLALERLAMDDAELASRLEAIKKEQESAPQRQHPGSPWRSRQYRTPFPNHYYAPPPHYPPYFIPSENGELGEYAPPPPPPMFYPMVPLQSFESDEGLPPSEQLMTPTFGAPYGYGYAHMPTFMPPPDMMYYPQATMIPPHMMVAPAIDEKESSDDTTPSNPALH